MNKDCKSCGWYGGPFSGGNQGPTCEHPRVRYYAEFPDEVDPLVIDEQPPAWFAREWPDLCGESGTLWRPRPPYWWQFWRSPTTRAVE